MANNFLNPLNPSNFGLNVTGNFNNLASSGTFRLPNSDLLNKINSKGGPSKDPIGTVQISAGGGNFDSNPNIYIRDEEFGEADNVIINSPGTNYTVNNSVTTTTLTGSGSGLVINIVTVAAGGISTVLIVDGGLGYVQGDTVRVDAGNNDAILRIGIIDLPKNRLVLDSRSNLPNLQGAPISGLVLIPPAENPNASFIATDGTVAYFSRFATNYGYSIGDTITLNNPNGGTPAVVTVNGTGINGQVGTANTSILTGGTLYQVNDVLIQVSTSGVGRLFTCTVNSVNGAGVILTYTVGLQYVKDFQGYTEGTGWQSFTSQGGVATAAGANTQLQFNNNGNLGANPGLTLDTSATPITLTSGISGGALSKNIFNSQEFTIEDTASGTARLHIESNQFAGSPAIELSHAPSNNLNAPGIKLSTTNFAGIALEVDGGQINLTSAGGQINSQTTSGSIRMRRGTANNYSTMEIQSGGDIFLETDVAGNQILLTTNNINSSILLETKSTNAPIELKTDNSDIDLNAGQNITMDATSGDIELSAPNGVITAKSELKVQTNTSVTTIDLDGSSDGVVTVGTNNNYAGNIKAINTKSGTGTGTAGYAVRIGSDPTNESGRIQLSNTTDQVTIDINGGDVVGGAGNNQPYIRLTDFIGTASGKKELQLRSLQQNRPCIEGFTSQGGANTMIIESNGEGSTGAAEHGQMIFSSAGIISGSIPVMKIERSNVNDDSTPTLQLQRPLRLWNATTANITNATTGLTKVGDMAYDTTEDCIRYRSNNGIVCVAPGQRILRVVQGSESLARNYNADGTGATSWTGNPATNSGSTVSLGPAGPPSIVGTIRSGTVFTSVPTQSANQTSPGSGSEDCNIIYLGIANQSGTGSIVPAQGTPNFRPVLCCRCMVPERVSATPTDLEYSLLVSGNLNIWAHQSLSTSGSDRINFSLGVFATLADSIGVPNGGTNGSSTETRNNPYTGPPNPDGAAGTAYNADYISSLAGTGNDTIINGTGGGIGGIGTWPRPLHSSYYTNLTQAGNTTGSDTTNANRYRYQTAGTFSNGTWTDPLEFTPGTSGADYSGWGDALKGDPYQDTPQEAQSTPRSGTISVPFSLLCNNPNLDYNSATSTWSKGPEREIYLWLCLGFNAGGNWDWLQVAKNGFGNFSYTNQGAASPFFGANSMKVTYLGAAAAASNGASSDA